MAVGAKQERTIVRKASGYLRNGEARSGFDGDLTAVMIEKLFQYHAWICGYCKHASPSYGYIPIMHDPAVSAKILWLRL